jgi:ABC-2 type transport system permease protein
MNSAGNFLSLLIGLNVRMARRRLSSLREQSWLMISVIAMFVASYWIFGYLVFHYGLAYLMKVPGGFGGIVVERMMYLFFAFLFLMLVFSNMIIGYSTLFKSTETQWMLTLPVSHRAVFQWKMVETMVLASWAFLFLSAPLILAYGTTRHASPLFFVKVFAVFLPFAVIPATVGALLVLLIARYFHRRLFKWALFGFGSFVVVCSVVFLRPVNAADLQEPHVQVWLSQLLSHSRMTVIPLLPSYWVASSIIGWGDGWSGRGLFFFLVLLSNALLMTQICVGASGRIFYEGWSRNHSQGSFRLGFDVLDRKIELPRIRLLERIINLLPWLTPPTQALVLKDIRVFWRDTSQWSQFVIFFGLLGLYVVNLRNVSYDWTNQYWATFVAFLNLTAASMTLATLTTRFVYPQFSLEGKRLWIVGMVPFGLKRVLLGKFWLSSYCSVAITLPLTMISSLLLHLPAWLTLLFGATAVLMGFALCGIAVGIGALFPNFGSGSTANRRDDNPAKIVSGFGGTLCFVVSLCYIIVIIAAEALPVYFLFSRFILNQPSQPWPLVGAWLLVAFLSLAAIVIPMSLALKRVETMEL